MYKDAPMCLNPTCVLFWRTGEELRAPQRLDYNKAFLELLDLPPNTNIQMMSIRPTPLDRRINEPDTQTRGMHCEKCGRLSSRYVDDRAETEQN